MEELLRQILNVLQEQTKTLESIKDALGKGTAGTGSAESRAVQAAAGGGNNSSILQMQNLASMLPSLGGQTKTALGHAKRQLGVDSLMPDALTQMSEKYDAITGGTISDVGGIAEQYALAGRNLTDESLGDLVKQYERVNEISFNERRRVEKMVDKGTGIQRLTGTQGVMRELKFKAQDWYYDPSTADYAQLQAEIEKLTGKGGFMAKMFYQILGNQQVHASQE